MKRIRIRRPSIARSVTLLALTLFILIPTLNIPLAHAVNSFVGQASNSSHSATSSLVVTYTSTVGNTIVVTASTQGGFTVSSVVDSGGSVYSQTVATTEVGGAAVRMEMWTTAAGQAKASTSFTITFSGNATDTFAAVAEYAGATSIGGNIATNSGNSNNPTITASIPSTTSWIVCGEAVDSLGESFTAQNGNVRTTVSGNPLKVSAAVLDNTGSLNPVCSTTVSTSAPWISTLLTILSAPIIFVAAGTGHCASVTVCTVVFTPTNVGDTIVVSSQVDSDTVSSVNDCTVAQLVGGNCPTTQGTTYSKEEAVAITSQDAEEWVSCSVVETPCVHSTNVALAANDYTVRVPVSATEIVIIVAEYQNANSAGVHTSGSSTVPGSPSVTGSGIRDKFSFAICPMSALATGETFTPTNGGTMDVASVAGTTTFSMALEHNTGAASGGSLICSATLGTAKPWTENFLELKVAIQFIVNKSGSITYTPSPTVKVGTSVPTTALITLKNALTVLFQSLGFALQLGKAGVGLAFIAIAIGVFILWKMGCFSMGGGRKRGRYSR